MATLLTFPARPANGGHLKYALPKVGAWSYEPKLNGWRAIIHTPTGAIWNRHGQRLSIEREFSTALAILEQSGIEWLDCEALSRRHKLGKGSLIVLDAPCGTPDSKQRYAPGSPLSYERRLSALHQTLIGQGLAEMLRPFDVPKENAVYVIPSVPESGRDALWQTLQEANQRLGAEFYEGLVAKKNDSLYPIQLNNPEQHCHTWQKHRFC